MSLENNRHLTCIVYVTSLKKSASGCVEQTLHISQRLPFLTRMQKGFVLRWIGLIGYGQDGPYYAGAVSSHCGIIVKPSFADWMCSGLRI
jgi:hypothetical protein